MTSRTEFYRLTDVAGVRTSSCAAAPSDGVSLRIGCDSAGVRFVNLPGIVRLLWVLLVYLYRYLILM